MKLKLTLDTLNTALSKLTDALLVEQGYLSAPDKNQTNWSELTLQKRQLIKDIETADSQRLLIVSQMGFSKDLEGSVKASEAEGCLKTWNSVYDNLRECARLNEINGRVINELMDQNSRVLDTLTTLNGQRIYGANGQHKKSGSQLNISA